MADKSTQASHGSRPRTVIRKRVKVRFVSSCELIIVDAELCALQDWLRDLGKDLRCTIICPEDDPECEDEDDGEGPPPTQSTNQNCTC